MESTGVGCLSCDATASRLAASVDNLLAALLPGPPTEVQSRSVIRDFLMRGSQNQIYAVTQSSSDAT